MAKYDDETQALGLLYQLPVVGGIFSGINNLIGNIFGGDDSAKRAQQRNQFNMHQQFLYNQQLLKEQNQYNTEMAKQQQGYNTNNLALSAMYQRQLNSEQQLAQRQLTQDIPLLTKRGLQSAGINPNIANGGYGSAQQVSSSSAPSAAAAGLPTVGLPSVGMASSSPGSSVDVASMINAFSNAKLANAQANLLKSQTKGKDIENSRMQEEDAFFKQQGMQLYFLDENGKQVVTNVKFSNKGAYQAWLAWRESDAQVTEYSARKARAVLDAYVTNSQYMDDTIRQHLIDMPNKIWNEICQKINHIKKDIETKDAQINLMDSEKALNELQYEIQSDKSIYEYIDKIFDSDKEFTLKDAVKMFVLCFSAAFSQTSMSFSKKTSSK